MRRWRLKYWPGEDPIGKRFRVFNLDRANG